MNTNLTSEYSLGWQMAKAQKDLKEAYDSFDNAESQYVDVAIHKINAASTLINILTKEMAKEKELLPTVPIKQNKLLLILYKLKGRLSNE